MLTYTTDEIFILLSNVSCIQDVQHIADYINENKSCYGYIDMLIFNCELVKLIDVFV